MIPKTKHRKTHRTFCRPMDEHTQLLEVIGNINALVTGGALWYQPIGFE